MEADQLLISITYTAKHHSFTLDRRNRSRQIGNILASYPDRSQEKCPGNLSKFKLLTSVALELAVPIRFQNASRDSCRISIAS